MKSSTNNLNPRQLKVVSKLIRFINMNLTNIKLCSYDKEIYIFKKHLLPD